MICYIPVLGLDDQHDVSQHALSFINKLQIVLFLRIRMPKLNRKLQIIYLCSRTQLACCDFDSLSFKKQGLGDKCGDTEKYEDVECFSHVRPYCKNPSRIPSTTCPHETGPQLRVLTYDLLTMEV